MSALRFSVHGIPGAQGSKRHVGHGIMVESSAKVKPWRSDVKAAAEDAILADTDWETITGAAAVAIVFQFRRPKSHYGTGRNAHALRDAAPRYPTSRAVGDLDKLVRSTLDALVASGALTDDSLIATISACKRWCDKGETPGARIDLWALPSKRVAA